MLVLHEYLLSIVDHVGFRKFVAALQPLFKLHRRNTIRKDIVERYNSEKKKAIEYMTSQHQGLLLQLICGPRTIKRRATWL